MQIALFRWNLKLLINAPLSTLTLNTYVGTFNLIENPLGNKLLSTSTIVSIKVGNHVLVTYRTIIEDNSELDALKGCSLTKRICTQFAPRGLGQIYIHNISAVCPSLKPVV